MVSWNTAGVAEKDLDKLIRQFGDCVLGMWFAFKRTFQHLEHVLFRRACATRAAGNSLKRRS